MAQRRMFSLKVIDTDEFLDMPTSSRLLYYDLSMRADDDGFVSAPKKVLRMTGASIDDLKILTSKGFLIPFESGVCVIKHWRIHNYIQKDRYTQTMYKEEFSKLKTAENGDYELLDTKCIQVGHEMDTQVRLGKDRLEEELEIGNNHKCEKDDNHHSMIKYDVDHQYYKIAIFIRQKILLINDKAKVPKDDPSSMSKWSDDVRKIVELDKRTLAEFQELTEFAFKSDFWSTVIQSPAGFRKNWDKMFAQMKRPASSKGNVISFDRQMEVCREFLEEG